MLDDPLERYHNRQLSWRNGVKNLVELGVGDEVLGKEHIVESTRIEPFSPRIM